MRTQGLDFEDPPSPKSVRKPSMSKKPSPGKLSEYRHPRFAFVVFLLFALAGLVALGGGNAMFRTRGGGGGGGGGGTPAAPCNAPSPITSSSGNVTGGVGTTASSTYM